MFYYMIATAYRKTVRETRKVGRKSSEELLFLIPPQYPGTGEASATRTRTRLNSSARSLGSFKTRQRQEIIVSPHGSVTARS